MRLASASLRGMGYKMIRSRKERHKWRTATHSQHHKYCTAVLSDGNSVQNLAIGLQGSVVLTLSLWRLWRTASTLFHLCKSPWLPTSELTYGRKWPQWIGENIFPRHSLSLLVSKLLQICKNIVSAARWINGRQSNCTQWRTLAMIRSLVVLSLV